MLWNSAFISSVILLASATPPAAQSSSAVIIDSDIRLFATMAALNAAGFDVEIGSRYHPVREEARKRLQGVDADLVSRMKKFYADHKGSETDNAQLPKYVSLALVVTDPPEFRIVLRDELMPPDVRSVAGFVELLREFFRKAPVAQMWGELRARYEAALNQMGPQLREKILRTDGYLRFPLGASTARQLAIYLELAAPMNSVNVRNYQDNYYVVLGASTSTAVDDVRHAYLHFLLDSLVLRNEVRTREKSSLLTLVANVEGVQSQYTSDFNSLVTESLIRAAELRMDRITFSRAKEMLDGYYRSGLLLVHYFYRSLEKFEAGEAGIRGYFPEMVDAIRVQEEEKRFQDNFHRIPASTRMPARAEVPAAPDPVRELLKQGEAAINSDDDENARFAFEQVLDGFDRTNGPALYGMGLIMSRQGDSEAAKQYFAHTVESPTADSSMKVWSYIFLGRIFDLECEREQALEHYRQAVKLGDNTRNAQAAARQGLEKPFGDGCK